ncbi:MAG: hypothetical protein OWQ54_02745 [Sulfolobaceae archaeon]|nr:hypothetical protein [Sulfolobaceae archaeon]
MNKKIVEAIILLLIFVPIIPLFRVKAFSYTTQVYENSLSILETSPLLKVKLLNDSGLYLLNFKLIQQNLSYGYINISFISYSSRLEIVSNISQILDIRISFLSLKNVTVWSGFNFSYLDFLLPLNSEVLVTFLILSGSKTFDVSAKVYPNSDVLLDLAYTKDKLVLVNSTHIPLTGLQSSSQIVPTIPTFINFSGYTLPALVGVNNNSFIVVGYGLNFTKALFYYIVEEPNYTFINITYNLDEMSKYLFGGIVTNLPYAITPKGLEGPIKPNVVYTLNSGLLVQVNESDPLYFIDKNGTTYVVKEGPVNVVKRTILFYGITPTLYEEIISRSPELLSLNSSIYKYAGVIIIYNGKRYLLISHDITAIIYMYYKPRIIEDFNLFLTSILIFIILAIISIFINRKYILKK